MIQVTAGLADGEVTYTVFVDGVETEQQLSEADVLARYEAASGEELDALHLALIHRGLVPDDRPVEAEAKAVPEPTPEDVMAAAVVRALVSAGFTIKGG